MSEAVVPSHFQTVFTSSSDRRLWFRWILANALGEIVGLGLAALVGVWFVLNNEKDQTATTIILTAILMILAGTFEGAVVGFAQSFVLRSAIKDFKARGWIIATAIGAFIAWTLGGIPSVAMSLQEQTSGATSPETNDAAMYGMAAVMGLALGFTLAVPQWLVLRKYSTRAGWWTSANALAWTFGMPVIFIAASNAPPSNPFLLILWIGFVIGLAGTIVGAIHGLFLIWLLQRRSEGESLGHPLGFQKVKE